jgi:hypothetical protein
MHQKHIKSTECTNKVQCGNDFGENLLLYLSLRSKRLLVINYTLTKSPHLFSNKCFKLAKLVCSYALKSDNNYLIFHQGWFLQGAKRAFVRCDGILTSWMSILWLKYYLFQQKKVLRAPKALADMTKSWPDQNYGNSFSFNQH